MTLSYNTLVVLCGTGLLGAVAGLVGSLAVLRGRALLGDALAHAAFPGLCMAFLVWGRRSLPAMLLGALASGLLGVAVVALLRRWTRIKEDAAIGIVLSVFFGFGITLSRLIQNRATEASKAGLDSYILGKTSGMLAADVALIGAAAAVCLCLVVLLYKEFRLLIFDPEFARAQGWPVLRLDLVLMALLAVTVVIGLPAVGVVLISAMLILPGASARFWTERLAVLLPLAALLGAAMGLGGTALSAQASRLPAGPLIVLAGTAVFFVSLIAAPRRGLVTRVVRGYWAARQRDARRVLHRMLDTAPTGLTVGELSEQTRWPASRVRRAMAALTRQQLLECGDHEHSDRATWRLNAQGASQAREVAHGQALWQALLTTYPELAASTVDFDRLSPAGLIPEETLAELEGTLGLNSAENSIPHGDSSPRSLTGG